MTTWLVLSILAECQASTPGLPPVDATVFELPWEVDSGRPFLGVADAERYAGHRGDIQVRRGEDPWGSDEQITSGLKHGLAWNVLDITATEVVLTGSGAIANARGEGVFAGTYDALLGRFERQEFLRGVYDEQLLGLRVATDAPWTAVREASLAAARAGFTRQCFVGAGSLNALQQRCFQWTEVPSEPAPSNVVLRSTGAYMQNIAGHVLTESNLRSTDAQPVVLSFDEPEVTAGAIRASLAQVLETGVVVRGLGALSAPRWTVESPDVWLDSDQLVYRGRLSFPVEQGRLRDQLHRSPFEAPAEKGDVFSVALRGEVSGDALRRVLLLAAVVGYREGCVHQGKVSACFTLDREAAERPRLTLNRSLVDHQTERIVPVTNVEEHYSKAPRVDIAAGRLNAATIHTWLSRLNVAGVHPAWNVCGHWPLARTQPGGRAEVIRLSTGAARPAFTADGLSIWQGSDGLVALSEDGMSCLDGMADVPVNLTLSHTPQGKVWGVIANHEHELGSRPVMAFPGGPGSIWSAERGRVDFALEDGCLEFPFDVSSDRLVARWNACGGGRSDGPPTELRIYDSNGALRRTLRPPVKTPGTAIVEGEWVALRSEQREWIHDGIRWTELEPGEEVVAMDPQRRRYLARQASGWAVRRLGGSISFRGETVRGASFARDGRLALSDGGLTLYDRRGRVLEKFDGFQHPLVTWSADGSQVAVGSSVVRWQRTSPTGFVFEPWQPGQAASGEEQGR